MAVRGRENAAECKEEERGELVERQLIDDRTDLAGIDAGPSNSH